LAVRAAVPFNALAESFLDSLKTELITDRVWHSRSQLELAVVEYIGWYNGVRLHESLDDLPPLEYEQQHAPREATTLAGANVTHITRFPSNPVRLITMAFLRRPVATYGNAFGLFEPFSRPLHLPLVAAGCDRSAPQLLHVCARHAGEMTLRDVTDVSLSALASAI